MGQGGYIWIVNATQKVLNRIKLHSYQMDSWDFGKQIKPNTSERFYIEYSEGILERWSDDNGEVVFELDETAQQFEVKIEWDRGVSVDWRNICDSSYYVYPGGPGEVGRLGWIHNGSLCMVIIEKGYQYALPNESHFLLDQHVSFNSSPNQSALAPSNWMEKHLDPIGKLTLTELTLPGSHDSGTYKPKTGLPFVPAYVATQSLSIHDQLFKGIRVLDLRIGQNRPGEYLICHAKFKTSYTLESALKEVLKFIDLTSKEIVILDFHYFITIGESSSDKDEFDYAQLKAEVESLLNGYCITYAEGHGKTLNDILSLGKNKRLVVAWNDTDSIDDSYMWPGVDQHWYEHAFTNTDLIKYIKEDFAAVSSDSYLWASCVFTAPAKNLLDPGKNALILFPECDNWFFGCSELSNKANIISTDFFDSYNNVINASIIANMLKAARK